VTSLRVVRIAANGVNTVGPAPLKTPPFPRAYASPLAQSPKLQKALDDAIRRVPSHPGWGAPYAITALDPSASAFPVAAFRPDDEKFGASMIKLVALYTAFELRKTVRAIAAEIGSKATAGDLLDRAKVHLDPRVIAYAAGSSGLRGVSDAQAVAQLKTTFTTAAGGPGVAVDFTDAYKKHQSRMISISDNKAAGECIHGCGYGMINGILENAGFFSPSTQTGLWLAGDFAQTYHYFKIPTASSGGVNFGPAAQAATVMQLVKLLALMFKGTLVDSGSSSEMLARLSESVAAGETFMTRASYFYGGGVAPWTVENTKLGIGPRGPGQGGPAVYSESCILKHTASGKRFAVSWMDFATSSLDPPSTPDEREFQRVVDVTLGTITDFLKP
jgi:hypothetical protein